MPVLGKSVMYFLAEAVSDIFLSYIVQIVFTFLIRVRVAVRCTCSQDSRSYSFYLGVVLADIGDIIAYRDGLHFCCEEVYPYRNR